MCCAQVQRHPAGRLLRGLLPPRLQVAVLAGLDQAEVSQGREEKQFGYYPLVVFHRRRINAEEKAKVVTVVWGTESIQFLAVLVILHEDDFEE